MQSEITLTYYDEAGRLRRVKVESKRFSIGRIADNDLMIEDSSLSRRHALIESFDDGVQVSDCGSRNGTFLNGEAVTFPVGLHDGDVINLADVCEITVEFSRAHAARSAEAVSGVTSAPPLSQEDLLRSIDSGLAAQRSTAAPAAKSRPEAEAALEDSASSSGLNVYIIAPVVALVLIALVALLAVVLKSSGPKKTDNERPANRAREARREEDGNLNSPPLPSPEEGGTIDASTPQNSDELDDVERNALALMRGISKSDSSPVLTEQNVKEIDERIKRYRGSSALMENLRAMKRGAQQLAGAAKSSDLKPSLIAFAALAKMDRDNSRGDAVAVAQSLIQPLTRARVVIGDELANESLLCVATLDPSTGGTIALRDTMSDLTKRRPDASAAMIRNIWFLHENQKLSPQAYDLVLRFLAIGAIAQNPQRYGVEAEPLTF